MSEQSIQELESSGIVARCSLKSELETEIYKYFAKPTRLMLTIALHVN